MTTPLIPQLQELLQTRTVIEPIINVTLRYGATSVPLPVTGGSILMDRRRRHRTTVNISTPVKGALPAVLTPLGAVLDVSLGIRSVDGTEDEVPIVTGALITAVDGQEVPGAIVSVYATERSEVVSRWRFEQPFTTPTTTLSQVVNLVLSNRGLPTSFAAAGPTVQTRIFGLDAEKDPWIELCELCEGLGWLLWMGRDGQPVLSQPPVDPPTTDLLIIEPNINLSSRPYNVVVGKWEPTDGSPPRYSLAQDLDPASPTFVGGPYGHVTYFFTTSLPASQAGADQATQAILERERYQGAGRRWSVPFDPTIDPGDVVKGPNFPLIPTSVVEAVTIDLGGNVTLEVSEVPQ